MFENIGTFFKKIMKTEPKQLASKDAAKERLHLVLMQDRANVSVDFLELMKQEIIDVIKKYIEIDEKSIDVRLTNQANDDGTNGAPALYANIPIVNIKNESKAEKLKENNQNIEEKHQEDVKLGKETQQEEMTENKIEENKTIELEKPKEEIKIEEEKKENDEEIDDVPTFDELLKQSEEDENNQKEASIKEEKIKLEQEETKTKKKRKNDTKEENKK